MTRWGFLSTARINDKVLVGAHESDDVQVVAVASRSRKRAEQYAKSRGIERAHGSYEQLLGDPDLDAVDHNQDSHNYDHAHYNHDRDDDYDDPNDHPRDVQWEREWQRERQRQRQRQRQ